MENKELKRKKYYDCCGYVRIEKPLDITAKVFCELLADNKEEAEKMFRERIKEEGVHLVSLEIGNPFLKTLTGNAVIIKSYESTKTSILRELKLLKFC